MPYASKRGAASDWLEEIYRWPGTCTSKQQSTSLFTSFIMLLRGAIFGIS